jgi:hypothetical protein
LKILVPGVYFWFFLRMKRLLNLDDLLQLPQPMQATVFLDGHSLATGDTWLSSHPVEGTFQSKTGDMPGLLPSNGATLKIEGTNATLRLRNPIHPSKPNGGAEDLSRFHFRFQAILI